MYWIACRLGCCLKWVIFGEGKRHRIPDIFVGFFFFWGGAIFRKTKRPYIFILDVNIHRFSRHDMINVLFREPWWVWAAGGAAQEVRVLGRYWGQKGSRGGKVRVLSINSLRTIKKKILIVILIVIVLDLKISLRVDKIKSNKILKSETFAEF